MTDWLKKRLSPVKRDEPRWQQFAVAIQHYWETLFDPLYARLSSLRSIFTAADAGQRQIVAELGGYFEDVPAENRPILTGMRKLELCRKETDVPIRMAIKRLGVSGVKWAPEYSLPEDGPYGTKFYHEYVGIPPASFLTSRGKLAVDLGEMSDEAVIPAIEQRIKRLKPLHIVYDGVLYVRTLKTLCPVVASTLFSGETVTVYPYMEKELDVQTPVPYVAGAITGNDTTTVYPR